MSTSGNGGRPVRWAAALPDFSAPAVATRIRLGAHRLRLVVTNLMPDPDGDPETAVVQVGIFDGTRPTTLADLGAGVEQCTTLWSYLCNRITEVVVDFYDAPPMRDGDPNPRLGCWGTRPDFKAIAREDDCTIALVIGIAIWLRGARPRGGTDDFLRELAEAITEALAFCVLEIARATRSG